MKSASFRNLASGVVGTFPLRHLFLFIGAAPNGEWLDGCVAKTPRALSSPARVLHRSKTKRAPLPLETSMPGVFAIGDVRAESTKRVGAAIGEGAAVAQQIHKMLEAAARQFASLAKWRLRIDS